MKIGVKTFNNPDYLKKFEDKVDFFEIMAIETNNYDFIKELKLPIVIHSQHRIFGVNTADKKKGKTNLSSINFARKIADLSNAKKIIIHPGEIENKNCSIEQAVSFIKNINDKRVIVENVYSDVEITRLCTTPSETKEFLKATGRGFCFDINHAIGSAVILKEDYIKFIKEFLKLKPVHYHFGGQKIKKLNVPWHEKEHLAFKESDFDLKEVLKLIPESAEITLETTTDVEKTMEDINAMKKWIEELKK
jgi:deoxyribonuclease-4